MFHTKKREKRVSEADMSTCLPRASPETCLHQREGLTGCMSMSGQEPNRIHVYIRARAHPDEGQAGLEALVHACLCSPAPQQPLQH